MTKLTITIDYSLSELKDKYREHFGYPKSEKVLKSDIANWVGLLANADLEVLEMEEENDD